jgi:cytochrome P450
MLPRYQFHAHKFIRKVTYAVYMLSEYPNVLQKLRAEILGRLGTQKAPESADLREMKYLRAVING